jgi:hypothetical protein
MNNFGAAQSSEARIRYLDGDFDILSMGDYVLCAVSGVKIPLDELKYWSVARQEAYATGQISFQRELEMHPELRKREK